MKFTSLTSILLITMQYLEQYPRSLFANLLVHSVSLEIRNLYDLLHIIFTSWCCYHNNDGLDAGKLGGECKVDQARKQSRRHFLAVDKHYYNDFMTTMSLLW